MRTRRVKQLPGLTISCGSGIETPQKNWLLLKTCWWRGIRSPAHDHIPNLELNKNPLKTLINHRYLPSLIGPEG